MNKQKITLSIIRRGFLVLIGLSIFIFTLVRYVEIEKPSEKSESLSDEQNYVPASLHTLSRNELVFFGADKTNLQSASASSVPKFVSDSYSPEQQRQLWLDWRQRMGYVDRETEATYMTYSQQQLQDLANRGDFAALSVLFSNAINNGQIVESQRLAHQAVVHGSTAAIVRLAMHKDPWSVPDTHKLTEEQRIPYISETLAWYYVGAMRGDVQMAGSYVNSLAFRYKKQYKTDLQLTTELQKKIATRAQEIMKELLAERNKLGLGDFDDYDPLEFKKRFAIE